jgi:hypothetical protein
MSGREQPSYAAHGRARLILLAAGLARSRGLRVLRPNPAQRRAILTRLFRDAGVGIVRGVPFPHASGGATYTMDFGASRR